MAARRTGLARGCRRFVRVSWVRRQGVQSVHQRESGRDSMSAFVWLCGVVREFTGRGTPRTRAPARDTERALPWTQTARGTHCAANSTAAAASCLQELEPLAGPQRPQRRRAPRPRGRGGHPWCTWRRDRNPQADTRGLSLCAVRGATDEASSCATPVARALRGRRMGDGTRRGCGYRAGARPQCASRGARAHAVASCGVAGQQKWRQRGCVGKL